MYRILPMSCYDAVTTSAPTTTTLPTSLTGMAPVNCEFLHYLIEITFSEFRSGVSGSSSADGQSVSDASEFDSQFTLTSSTIGYLGSGKSNLQSGVQLSFQPLTIASTPLITVPFSTMTITAPTDSLLSPLSLNSQLSPLSLTSSLSLPSSSQTHLLGK